MQAPLDSLPLGRGRKGVSIAVASLLAVAFGSLAAPSRASAADRIYVVLDYQVRPAAAGCPSADDFRTSVTKQLGYDAFQPDAAWRVAVVLDRRDERYGAHLRWTDLNGRRIGDRQLVSRATDCRELGVSLAFSVTVQVQLLAALLANAPAPSSVTLENEPGTPVATEANALPPPPSPSPAPSTAPPPESPAKPTEEPTAAVSDVAPPPADPAPTRSEVTLAAALGPGLSVGLEPQPTATGRLSAALGYGALSLELGVAGSSSGTSTRRDGSGVDVRHWLADLGGCWHRAIFRTCLVGGAGLLQTHGFGVDDGASPSGFFYQAGLRVGARKSLGARTFLSFRADGLATMTRVVVFLNRMEAWRMPRWAGLFGIDLGIAFF